MALNSFHFPSGRCLLRRRRRFYKILHKFWGQYPKKLNQYSLFEKKEVDNNASQGLILFQRNSLNNHSEISQSSSRPIVLVFSKRCKQLLIQIFQFLQDIQNKSRLEIKQFLIDNIQIIETYVQQFIGALQIVLDLQYGHLSKEIGSRQWFSFGYFGIVVSQIVYLLLKFSPGLYFMIWQWIRSIYEELKCSQFADNNFQCKLNRIYFLTRCYIYGFPILTKQFTEDIYLKLYRLVENEPDCSQDYRLFLLFELSYLYLFFQNLSCPSLFLYKFRMDFFTNLQRILTKSSIWLINERKDLLKLGKILQKEIYIKMSKQCLYQPKYEKNNNELKYEKRYQLYNSVSEIFDRFQRSTIKQTETHRLESLQDLKLQCIYFRNFDWQNHIAPYQKQLYYQANQNQNISFIKLVSIQEDQFFLSQYPNCNKIERAVQLSQYFIQNLNSQQNLNKFIQDILKQRQQTTNLPYIVRLLAQLSHKIPNFGIILQKQIQFFPYLSKLLSIKNKKSDKNPNKYHLKLFIELEKFNILPQNNLIQQLHQNLKNRSIDILMASLDIIEQLGRVAYYRDFDLHKGINKCFLQIDSIADQKTMLLNLDIFNRINALKEHLRSDEVHQIKIPHNMDKIYTTQLQKLLKIDIKLHFEKLFNQCKNLLKKHQNTTVICKFIEIQVSHQAFALNYYYASLISELKSQKLSSQVLQMATKTINGYLNQAQSQQACCWFRFYGELYNYQLINKKQLIDFLSEILFHDFKVIKKNLLGCRIQCFNSCLETSKIYLVPQKQKTNNLLMVFVLRVKKYILEAGPLQNFIIEQQLEQILHYFHPHIMEILRTSAQINAFLQQIQKQDQKVLRNGKRDENEEKDNKKQQHRNKKFKYKEKIPGQSEKNRITTIYDKLIEIFVAQQRERNLEDSKVRKFKEKPLQNIKENGNGSNHQSYTKIQQELNEQLSLLKNKQPENSVIDLDSKTENIIKQIPLLPSQANEGPVKKIKVIVRRRNPN